MGIDVGIVRGCAYAVLDSNGQMIDSGWFEREPSPALLDSIVSSGQTTIGIDAPRCVVPRPREWFWDGAKTAWRGRTKERGAGRHCEIAVKAHHLGNPQWSPIAGDDIPPWMSLGFELFVRFSAKKGLRVHEVFPTASYHCLEGKKEPRVRLNLASFRPGPKDLLDASVAALTVREFDQGRGVEVGGGDGLGTIVLPTPLRSPIAAVLRWPDKIESPGE